MNLNQPVSAVDSSWTPTRSYEFGSPTWKPEFALQISYRDYMVIRCSIQRFLVVAVIVDKVNTELLLVSRTNITNVNWNPNTFQSKYSENFN